MSEAKPQICHKCQHYYITWDPQQPHGCKGMGFKSRRVPIWAVRRYSHGMDCQLYRPKKKTRAPASAITDKSSRDITA